QLTRKNMRNKTKLFLGGVLIAVTALALGSLFFNSLPTITSAAEEKQDNSEIVEKCTQMAKRKQEMQDIFENNDYNAWKSLMNEKVKNLRERADKIEQSITEENFAKLVEAHKLMKEGKDEEAKKIFDELGVPSLGFGGRGPKGIQE
ncbi:hypothetical protein COY23_02240, partial [bacterium (Candidatus Torokbacteria) CG_4_10_14_0_2_um_filter_35_8]